MISVSLLLSRSLVSSIYCFHAYDTDKAHYVIHAFVSAELNPSGPVFCEHHCILMPAPGHHPIVIGCHRYDEYLDPTLKVSQISDLVNIQMRPKLCIVELKFVSV